MLGTANPKHESLDSHVCHLVPLVEVCHLCSLLLLIGTGEISELNAATFSSPFQEENEHRGLFWTENAGIMSWDWQTLVRKSFLISLLRMSCLFPPSISHSVSVCGGDWVGGGGHAHINHLEKRPTLLQLWPHLNYICFKIKGGGVTNWDPRD